MSQVTREPDDNRNNPQQRRINMKTNEKDKRKNSRAKQHSAKDTGATVERLLAECEDHQFVVVVYDEHGKVRVPPEIAPIGHYAWAGIRSTKSPIRTLLEIHDLPEPDLDADEDAPVSQLVIIPKVVLSRGGVGRGRSKEATKAGRRAT